MKRRTTGLLATIALLAASLTALGGSTPASAAPAELTAIEFCSASVAPPCLEKFQRDDHDVLSTDYRLLWNEVQPKAGFYSWWTEKYFSGGWRSDMSDSGVDESTHTFKFTLNFGSFNPVTFSGQGAPFGANPVVRYYSGGSYHLTVTARPIHRLTGCNMNVDPETCPTTAPNPQDDSPGYLDGVVNDARWFGETTAEHLRSAGLWEFSNVQVTKGAPIITTDPVTGNSAMTFSLQNTHESADHVTFVGEQHLRLPNAMLRDVYGIPDPDTMTATSLGATISGTGGTITITPEDGHDAMLVDVTGVTFSKRSVKVKKGVLLPTAPTNLIAGRISATSGRLYFTKSTARGARPTGYGARCAYGGTLKTATGSSAKGITITGIGSKNYACRVRAASKAGYGPWSALVHFTSQA